MGPVSNLSMIFAISPPLIDVVRADRNAQATDSPMTSLNEVEKLIHKKNVASKKSGFMFPKIPGVMACKMTPSAKSIANRTILCVFIVVSYYQYMVYIDNFLSRPKLNSSISYGHLICLI